MLTPKEILQHVGWIHIWIIWGILLSGWNSTVDIDATDPDSKLLGASSRDTSNILKSRFQRYSKFEAPVAPCGCFKSFKIWAEERLGSHQAPGLWWLLMMLMTLRERGHELKPWHVQSKENEPCGKYAKGLCRGDKMSSSPAERYFLAEMAAVRDHVAVNWKNQSGNDFHNFTHLVCLSQSRRACRILWNLVSALPGTFAAEVQMG